MYRYTLETFLQCQLFLELIPRIEPDRAARHIQICEQKKLVVAERKERRKRGGIVRLFLQDCYKVSSVG